jgi:hypothetical protein
LVVEVDGGEGDGFDGVIVRQDDGVGAEEAGAEEQGGEEQGAGERFHGIEIRGGEGDWQSFWVRSRNIKLQTSKFK